MMLLAIDEWYAMYECYVEAFITSIRLYLACASHDNIFVLHLDERKLRRQLVHYMHATSGTRFRRCKTKLESIQLPQTILRQDYCSTLSDVT
jgi:hypothetical protein